MKKIFIIRGTWQGGGYPSEFLRAKNYKIPQYQVSFPMLISGRVYPPLQGLHDDKLEDADFQGGFGS